MKKLLLIILMAFSSTVIVSQIKTPKLERNGVQQGVANTTYENTATEYLASELGAEIKRDDMDPSKPTFKKSINSWYLDLKGKARIITGTNINYLGDYFANSESFEITFKNKMLKSVLIKIGKIVGSAENSYIDAEAITHTIEPGDYINIGMYLDYVGSPVFINGVAHGAPITDYQDNIGVSIEVPTLDFIPPKYVYETTNIFTNINKPLTESEIIALFKAYDDEDGDVSNNIIVVSSDYNVSKVGKYTIKLSVSDSSNNVAELNVIVNLVDVSAPTIVAKQAEIISYQSDPIPNDFNIHDYFTIIDNVDNIGDLTYNLKDFGGFKTNNMLVKDYVFELTVSDKSGNSTKTSFTIKVRDDIKPIITGQDVIEISNVIGLSREYVLSKYTAVDNVEVVNFEIKTNSKSYFLNKLKVGDYVETLVATDASGNITEKKIVIKVIDSVAPIFHIDEAYYIVLDNTPVSTAQIIDFLIKTGQFETDSYAVISDNYEKNASKTGDYEIELSVKGVRQVISVSVIHGTEDEINNESELGFFARIWKVIKNFFARIWEVIKWPFEKLYELITWLVEKIGFIK